MNSVSTLNSFYKGPITCCEYVSDDKILIGNGPYISLVNDESFNEIARTLVLRYRVIHNIVKNSLDPRLICVFGQKAFNLVRIDLVTNIIETLNPDYIELEDWIFDIFYMTNEYLVIVCAHNQCILFDLKNKSIIKNVECTQKCMLYSAKIIDLNKKNRFEDILIASGTIYNQILIWSVLNGTILLTLDGHQGVIFNLEYSYETNLLFSTSDDRSINVWQLEIDNLIDSDLKTVKSYQLNKRFYGHDARVWKCLSFIDPLTNIQYLCSIGEDLNTCLWNLKDKSLIHRFDAMKKGFKNIWSITLNLNKMKLITGWSDGGLRKLLLQSYLVQNKSADDNKPDNNIHYEWNLKYENDKDYIRNILFLNDRILCCTHLGCLYMINTHSNDLKNQQKFIFKSVLLSGYNVMSKFKLNNNHFYLAIGTLKGFIYLLSFDFKDKDEINMECINSMSMEEDLAEESLYSVATSQPKICNLDWFKYKIGENFYRYFLLSSFGFMNGLTHLYEFFPESFKLNLIGRLYLPVTKHRWFASFSIVSINKVVNEDYNKQYEIFHIVVGDRCGSFYYYKLETNKSKIENTSEEEDDYNNLNIRSLKLIKPFESFKNLTKDNSSISAIYSKNLTKNEEKINQDILNFLVICCCKDGFYRVFELNNQITTDNDSILVDDITEEDDINENKCDKEDKTKTKENKSSFLKLSNKFQINSYIDIIESFIFDDEIEETLKKQSLNKPEFIQENFELDSSLRLGFCFYSDKFLLWSFQSNRSLFDLKCGGAHRSWDFEFSRIENESESILFRFVYVKNKVIEEARKVLNINEIDNPIKQFNSHLCQTFHGNTITVCKYLFSAEYLITGSEDTQLNITKLEWNNYKKNESIINHQFHLQGHDSVVKCIDYLQLNQNELLIVSAGGKANIKLWKAIIENNKIITRIVHLYEFKRFRMRKTLLDDDTQKSEKPWLYIDLKSNPDIRFMDVFIKKSPSNQNEFIISFVCSDGCLRIFKYMIDLNKLLLVNKYSYPKCLFGIKYLSYQNKSYNLCYGSDGNFVVWELNLEPKSEDGDITPLKFEKIHQSGINSIDIWHEKESNLFFVASGGDDTAIKVSQLDLSDLSYKFLIGNNNAHASAIVSVKFLMKEILISLAKDQRLIIWNMDYRNQTVNPIRIIFINVADASSMDITKTESNIFKISIVGVGLEIIELKLS